MRHILFIFLSLFVILGIPAIFFSDWSQMYLGKEGVDAVTGASMEVPDQPSGEFYVFVNKNFHPKTLPEWQNFFEEKPVEVIMEDISCQIISSDGLGFELAQRYRARLAENQMKVKTENTTMVLSKIENAVFDVAIVSKEFAEFTALEKVFTNDDVLTITVKGQAG